MGREKNHLKITDHHGKIVTITEQDARCKLIQRAIELTQEGQRANISSARESLAGIVEYLTEGHYHWQRQTGVANRLTPLLGSFDFEDIDYSYRPFPPWISRLSQLQSQLSLNFGKPEFRSPRENEQYWGEVKEKLIRLSEENGCDKTRKRFSIPNLI